VKLILLPVAKCMLVKLALRALSCAGLMYLMKPLNVAQREFGLGCLFQNTAGFLAR